MCICRFYHISFNICTVLHVVDQTHPMEPDDVFCVILALYGSYPDARHRSFFMSGEFDIHGFSHHLFHQERIYL